jgi:hypothetical protein
MLDSVQKPCTVHCYVWLCTFHKPLIKKLVIPHRAMVLCQRCQVSYANQIIF